MNEFGQQDQQEKDKKCAEIAAILRAEREEATRRGVVLVQISPRRWMVVKILSPVNGVFRGETVAIGPKDEVMQWINNNAK